MNQDETISDDDQDLSNDPNTAAEKDSNSTLMLMLPLLIAGAIFYLFISPKVKDAQRINPIVAEKHSPEMSFAPDSNAYKLAYVATSLGMHAMKNGSKISASVSGTDGKSSHSWRVALLPFIGHEELFKQYKLDEPWDSDHNKKLLAAIPSSYSSNNDPSHKSEHSSYGIITGDGLAFSNKIPDPGISLFQFTDGLDETIAVVEMKSSIPWTKPEDVSWEQVQIKDLGQPEKEYFLVAFFGGKVIAISKKIPREEFRKLLTPASNDKIEIEKWQVKID